MSKKPIIVFEGIEGSGKSHHINKVSKYLQKNKNKLHFSKYSKQKKSFSKIKKKKISKSI